MYGEDNLVMISALQHLAFCERQCALIHVEQQWAENRLTVLGELLHEKVHSAIPESRGDLRIARTLKLVSYRLGLVGQADAVEFHRSDKDATGVTLKGIEGKWIPFPIEYKKGKPKKGREDEIQLCAQALCLEEQLGISIYEGALFYGEKRRRHSVIFNESLRAETEDTAVRLHALVESGKTPPAVYGPKCDNCSLYSICNPKLASFATRRGYERMLFAEDK